jgi:hypothetical protein
MDEKSNSWIESLHNQNSSNKNLSQNQTRDAERKNQIELLQDQASAVQGWIWSFNSVQYKQSQKWNSITLLVPLCVLDIFRQPAHGALAKEY